VHVNNPAQLFFARMPTRRAPRAPSDPRMRAAGARPIRAARAHAILKLHKTRHLPTMHCARRSMRAMRDATHDGRPRRWSAMARRTRAGARRAADFASHKSICAKTAQAAAAFVRVDHRPWRGTEMDRARKNPRRHRRGFVCGR
jgi:hypothetical protein